VTVELAEVDVHEAGVEKSHKAFGEKSLKGLAVAMKIVGVIFKAYHGERGARRNEESCDHSSAFFLGGEAPDQSIGACGHHEGRAVVVKDNGVGFSVVGLGPHDDAFLEVRGID
jgi:hypothetical protein